MQIPEHIKKANQLGRIIAQKSEEGWRVFYVNDPEVFVIDRSKEKAVRLLQEKQGVLPKNEN